MHAFLVWIAIEYYDSPPLLAQMSTFLITSKQDSSLVVSIAYDGKALGWNIKRDKPLLDFYVGMSSAK